MRLIQWIMVLLAIMLVTPVAAWAQSPSADEIDKAIERGKAWLLSRRDPKVSWELPTEDISANHPGGLTSLITLALISADEKASGDALKPGIDKLRALKTESVYAVGMRASLFSLLPSTPENVAVRAMDRNFFLKAVYTDKINNGMYGYYPPTYKGPHYNFPHISPTGYGVLGAWALGDAGQEFPQNFWLLMNTTWRKAQQKSGAWQYRVVGGPPEQHVDIPTMTSAGVASLLITQDFLVAEQKGNPVDPALDAGIKWLDQNWKMIDDKGYSSYAYYNIERIGVASGLRKVGSHDWYSEGARSLLQTQGQSGNWGNGNPLATTSFAILFLTHGRAPVMLNKLEYNVLGKDKKPVLANWNQRPRDAANLVLWAKRQLERDLRWQRIDLNASTNDLLEAPILYITGDQKLEFADSEISRLRDFCQAGGIILGAPERGDQDFAKSFRELGSKLFKQYEFRKLPANHPIFTSQMAKASSWKKQVALEGLSNGAREMMILVPDYDPSKYWSTRQVDSRPEAFQVAANIYLYSIGKDFGWQRGRGYYVPPVAQPAGEARKVVRIEHSGNWNPEPYGWKRLQALLARDNKIALTIETAKLGEGKLKGAKLAHMTGTAELTPLTEAQKAEIKEFVNSGGTLLVDSCGGSPEFANFMDGELRKMFPDGTAELNAPIPQKSPIFSKDWGTPIEKIQLRDYALAQGGVEGNGPQLRVITINKRPAVIFSREDLSTGLVGTPVDAITGYTPATALAIVRNIVMKCGK